MLIIFHGSRLNQIQKRIPLLNHCGRKSSIFEIIGLYHIGLESFLFSSSGMFVSKRHAQDSKASLQTIIVIFCAWFLGQCRILIKQYEYLSPSSPLLTMIQLMDCVEAIGQPNQSNISINQAVNQSINQLMN